MKPLVTVKEKIPTILWAFMVLCGSRAADNEFVPAVKSRPGGEKYGNKKDNVGRKMVVGRKCRQRKQINTTLQLILSRKTKPHATYSAPEPQSQLPRPGKSHRLHLSSRRFCAVESCIVFCCGCDRPDGKQQLSTYPIVCVY